MKTLIFVEDIVEAQELVLKIKKKVIKNNDLLIITLNPNIQSYLKTQKILSKSSAQYTNNKFYENLMSECEILEKKIIKNFFKQNKQYSKVYFKNTLKYHLVLCWRHFLWNIELIHSVLKKHNPKKIIYFKNLNKENFSPWVEDNEMYLGNLIKIYENKKIKFLEIPIKRDFDIEKKSFFSRLMYYFIKNLFLNNFFKLHNYKIILYPSKIKNLQKIFLKMKDDNLVFFSYSGIFSIKIFIINIFNLFIKKITKNKKNIFFNLPSFEKDLDFISNKNFLIFKNNLNNITRNKKNNFFIYKKINYSNFINLKIKNGIISKMYELEKKKNWIKTLFLKINPKMVISHLNLGENGYLGHFAKINKIPSLLVSHGSHTPCENKISIREQIINAEAKFFNNYEYLGLQSPFAEKFLKQNNFTKNKHIKILPTAWGSKIKKNHDNNFTIVHASTIKKRHTRFFIYETSDEYLLSIIQICKCVQHCPKIKLIIKIRNDQKDELSEETLLETIQPFNKYNNIIIESRKNFYQVLKKCNLLISFSSTTIEESIYCNVPVLIFGGSGRYNHIDLKNYIFSNKIDNPITIIQNTTKLKKYFDLLNKKIDYLKFNNKSFNRLRYHDSNTIKLDKWIEQKISK
jgi:hypothetical protein